MKHEPLNLEEHAAIDALMRAPAPVAPADLLARFRQRAAPTAISLQLRPKPRWPIAIAATIALLLGGGWLIEWRGRQVEVKKLRAELQEAVTDLSTSRRLLVVMNTGAAGLRDRDIVAMLSQVLQTDSSATVRVAAVEALAQLSINALAEASAVAAVHERSVFVLTAMVDASTKMSIEQRDGFLTALLSQPDLSPTLRADAKARISS